MTKHFRYLVLFLTALFGSCKDDPEQIPAYLNIQKFTVNEVGSARFQEIPEVWVYVNGEFLGDYTLPALVPVLASGDTELWLYPGIKENGNPATPNIYDFLYRYVKGVQLKAGEVSAPINPTTSYKSESIFAWPIERTTFDGNSNVQFEDRDADLGSTYTISASDGFDGRSLFIAVDSLHPQIAIASESADLPTSGERQTWLELHRKNDVVFRLSLIGYDLGGSEKQYPVYEFNPVDSWKKIYINLTDYLSTSRHSKHRLYFQVDLPKNANGKYTQSNGTVGLDNVRLVHF